MRNVFGYAFYFFFVERCARCRSNQIQRPGIFPYDQQCSIPVWSLFKFRIRPYGELLPVPASLLGRFTYRVLPNFKTKDSSLFKP